MLLSRDLKSGLAARQGRRRGPRLGLVQLSVVVVADVRERQLPHPLDGRRAAVASSASGSPVTRLLRGRALLPLNDPFFKEAFAHDVHYHSSPELDWTTRSCARALDVDIRRFSGSGGDRRGGGHRVPVMWGLFRVLTHQAAGNDRRCRRSPGRRAICRPHAVPGCFRRGRACRPTSPSPREDADGQRRRELESYGWVDKAARRGAHLIAEAKKLMAAGLPSGRPVLDPPGTPLPRWAIERRRSMPRPRPDAAGACSARSATSARGTCWRPSATGACTGSAGLLSAGSHRTTTVTLKSDRGNRG